VLEVPTTASLRQQAWAELRGRAPVPAAGYDLFYLHDYDLMRARTRLAAAALLLTSTRARWTTAGELAALAMKERATS